MIKETDFLVEGEKAIGEYSVFILQRVGEDSWSPAVMPLDALVTNLRLLLRPMKKKYAPATLPARYLRDITLTQKGHNHCVALTLITGHELYLLNGTGKLDALFDDLSLMKVPRPKLQFQFDDKVARADIQRLISFFGKLSVRQDASPS